MKKIILLLCLSTVGMHLFAQKDTADNYVNKFMTIPAMDLRLVPDSSIYKNAMIKKNAPFIVMFFSPDCDLCQEQTRELVAHKKELAGVQVLMVSGASYRELIAFREKFGLANMFNVNIAYDPRVTMGSIYRLKTYPSMYIYDKNGNLAKAFVGKIGMPAVLAAVE